MEYELIEVNGNKWQKYKGNEGQDVYIAEFMIDQDKLLGKYVDQSFYDILLDSDADVYLPPICDLSESSTCDKVCLNCVGEDRVALKFRKNVFSLEEQSGAFEGLFGAATESHNRGLAAGPVGPMNIARDWLTLYQQKVLEYYIGGQSQSIDGSDPLDIIREKYEGKTPNKDTRAFCWIREKVLSQFEEYHGFFPLLMNKLETMSIEEAKEYARMIKETWVSKTTYAAGLWSGIAGYYGRYPRIPYGRPTAYTENNQEDFEKCYSFARKLESEFARLLPTRHAAQKKYADRIDDRFLIGKDTTFTTITVNTTTSDRNARMACHRDAGSLNPGFSNLTVVTKEGKDWKGGYLVAPEIRMAINVRPGDLLLIDNMRVIHGNTEILPPDSGIKDMLRMSLVFYFREDMENLGSWEYETIRRDFVNTRKNNKQHDLWHERWNGVSGGMWDSQEWYDFLEGKAGKEIVNQYHPEAYKKETSLSQFF